MNKTIIKLAGLILLTGCASKTPNNIQYENLSVIEGELLKEKWQKLMRYSARYPFAAAVAGKNGCTIVEYVITPEYDITNINVKETTDKVFNKAAKSVVSNWKWKELPKGILTEAVKTQTQFDFCIESEERPCSEEVKKFSCNSLDSISSIGEKVKRG